MNLASCLNSLLINCFGFILKKYRLLSEAFPLSHSKSLGTSFYLRSALLVAGVTGFQTGLSGLFCLSATLPTSLSLSCAAVGRDQPPILFTHLL